MCSYLTVCINLGNVKLPTINKFLSVRAKVLLSNNVLFNKVYIMRQGFPLSYAVYFI